MDEPPCTRCCLSNTLFRVGVGKDRNAVNVIGARENIEASFGLEQALQSECEASLALLGEMHVQQAEFSHAKSQEFEALQAQLVSLSGDLAKQLKLVDAEVEEADTLKENFEASQLELERFSVEYCV
ncbi:hypothetical protein HPB47_014687 [Ixodes persulcatus]|uniref:Uncharacterized protein n=1 Tax=Ixodes persulcatus TaxID=34615 RepID=A0AC60QVH0_IXOPE|nr:hypothetical protein HPB47_014687 [Ixodes persulcatus]